MESIALLVKIASVAADQYQIRCISCMNIIYYITVHFHCRGLKHGRHTSENALANGGLIYFKYAQDVEVCAMLIMIVVFTRECRITDCLMKQIMFIGWV